MPFGGLLARALLLKSQLNSVRCPRCGNLYHKKLPQCPHCRDLDDAAVRRLLETRERERRGNARLGRIFFVIALAVGVLMLLFAVG